MLEIFYIAEIFKEALQYSNRTFESFCCSSSSWCGNSVKEGMYQVIVISCILNGYQIALETNKPLLDEEFLPESAKLKWEMAFKIT